MPNADAPVSLTALTALTALSPLDGRYRRKVVALALRQLLRLLKEYPREPFLAAVREAGQYGLYDLDRVERMILRRVARDYFLLDGDKEGGQDDD